MRRCTQGTAPLLGDSSEPRAHLGGREKGSPSSSRITHAPSLRWARSWAGTWACLSKLPLDFGHITLLAQARPTTRPQPLLCFWFLVGVGSCRLFLRRVTSSRLSSAAGVEVSRVCQPYFWGFSSNPSGARWSSIPLALLARYWFETNFTIWNLENTAWARAREPLRPILEPVHFPGNISLYGDTVPMSITASHLHSSLVYRRHHLAPTAMLQWIIIYIIMYLCIYFQRWLLLMVHGA